MDNRFASWFAYGHIKADGSIQVAYSTAHYGISKFPSRWAVDSVVSSLNERCSDLTFVVLTYPEAVLIGIN